MLLLVAYFMKRKTISVFQLNYLLVVFSSISTIYAQN